MGAQTAGPEVDGRSRKRSVAGEEAGKNVVGAPPEEENFEFPQLAFLLPGLDIEPIGLFSGADYYRLFQSSQMHQKVSDARKVRLTGAEEECRGETMKNAGDAVDAILQEFGQLAKFNW